MAGSENSSRAKGARYEALAAEYLERKGFEILRRNYSSRFGEIDLIAKKERYLVFVEVKYRETDNGGHPLEAVTFRKQRRICRTAAEYCMRHGIAEETPCRFDVVGLLGSQIIHVENAFSYTD